MAAGGSWQFANGLSQDVHSSNQLILALEGADDLPHDPVICERGLIGDDDEISDFEAGPDGVPLACLLELLEILSRPEVLDYCLAECPSLVQGRVCGDG